MWSSVWQPKLLIGHRVSEIHTIDAADLSGLLEITIRLRHCHDGMNLIMTFAPALFRCPYMRPLSIMSRGKFEIIFSDIGGVLGTNGWGSDLRAKVVSQFNLDDKIIDKRHHLMFDSYERGFLTFEQYLQYVFFDEPRSFQLAEVRDFIYAGSVPWLDNIQLFQRVKLANGLKLALISNEGQGITEYRMQKFGLPALADFIVVSHYVHMRKPDAQIWELALNLAQVKVENAIYVDDREIFVRRAADLGFTAFQHLSVEKTQKHFEKLGLKTN